MWTTMSANDVASTAENEWKCAGGGVVGSGGGTVVDRPRIQQIVTITVRPNERCARYRATMCCWPRPVLAMRSSCWMQATWPKHRIS